MTFINLEKRGGTEIGRGSMGELCVSEPQQILKERGDASKGLRGDGNSCNLRVTQGGKEEELFQVTH